MKKITGSLIVTLMLPVLCFAETALNPITNDLPSISDTTAKVNQLALLDNLIEATQKNLENEKQLRSLIQEYLQTQKIYLQNVNNKDQTLVMVKNAHRVLEKIKEIHLVQAFDPEFISELTFFSQIAVKRGIPKP